MHIGEILFTGSSLSEFVFVSLAALSLSSAVLMAFSEALGIKEKIIEFKKSYGVYNNFVFSYKDGEIREEEIFIKKREFLKIFLC